MALRRISTRKRRTKVVCFTVLLIKKKNYMKCFYLDDILKCIHFLKILGSRWIFKSA